jgi:alanine racemase
MSRPTTVTIDLGALRHNLARVRALAPGSKVMAVVKADGYGHGLERVARALADAEAFGVAALSDAERLRAIGLRNRIVLLSGFDEAADLELLRALEVDTVVHHDSQLAMLEADARGSGTPPLRVWLKFDTGMHRLGFDPLRAAELHARLRALPNVAQELVAMTHFASSDEFCGAQTVGQMQRFAGVAAVTGAPVSLSNSAGVLGWPDAHRDWVRAGGALYGLSVVDGKCGADFGLQPVMKLSTRLIAVNQVRKGERVGYSATWECPEDMPVGVAAIGYGDGYPRSVASGTPVLVAGQRVPLVGRVSMDLMTIDLRTLPGAKVGDEVVLWGPELPAEEIAAAAGTISYELTCSITRRVRAVTHG